MTAIDPRPRAADPRPADITERYPGETLHLLRSVAADVTYLRAQFERFAPLLDRVNSGGLLAGRRAARGRETT